MKHILPALVLAVGFMWPAMAAEKAQLTVNGTQPGARISEHIYGHFSEHLGHCIYGGIWVGPDSDIPNINGYRSDVVEALKTLGIPNLRWPGGCFADEYHWRDGIGPRESRPKMINTHWGGVVEDNSFGTHEFLDFCELIGAEPYICGNVGSGTVEEMSKWVEYITFDGESPMANLRRSNGRDKPWKVKFWGVGNESWGCGGNMTAEFYSDQYRRYATYCRNYGDNRLYKVACGPSSNDVHWTETIMKNVGRGRMSGLSLHHYTVPHSWAAKGSATVFSEEEYMITLEKAWQMDDLITRHSDIMDKYDPDRRVSLCVDEWGNWYDVEPGTNPGFLFQQNTLRDAITCALNFNIFHAHCDRVRMANIAQMVNVLQAIVFAEGPNMVLTPTYYAYLMYKPHREAEFLPVGVDAPAYACGTRSLPSVSATASKSADGKVHISLINVNPYDDIQIECRLEGIQGKVSGADILTSDRIQDCNTYEQPDKVKVKEFKGAKIGKDGVLSLRLPAKSIVTLTIN